MRLCKINIAIWYDQTWHTFFRTKSNWRKKNFWFNFRGNKMIFALTIASVRFDVKIEGVLENVNG